MKDRIISLGWVRPLIALSVIGIIAFFGLIPNSLYQRVEQLAYDQLMSWSAEYAEDHRIVLVDIDESTIKEIGSWPWPRDQMATLIETLLADYQIAVLGVDVVFPDRREGDDRLALLLNQPNVVMSQVLDFSETSTNQSGELVTGGFKFSGRAPGISGYIGNNEELLTRNARVGHISPVIDQDGKVRRIFPVACELQLCTDTLSLEMYQALNAGLPSEIAIKAHTMSLSMPGLEPLNLPLDRENALLIPFRVKPDGFQTISASSVITHQANIDILKNAVVVLGSTALGLGDFVATPTRNIVPGLELHAQIFSSILEHDFIIPKHNAIWLIVPMILIFLLYLIMPLRSTKAIIVAMFIGLVLVVSIEVILFSEFRLWIPSSPMVLSVLMLGLSSIVYENFNANRQLFNVAHQVSRFIPESLTKRLVRGGELGPQNEERELTILVADMRGFTTASEGKSPNEVALLAQKCLETLTNAVYAHKGTIEKFSGDGLMAIWGAPRKDHAHAKHAIESGLAMIAAIRELSGWFEENGFPKMRVSIGINTGDGAVGVFGGESHLAWTAHGDAVNVASRIEQLTRLVGDDLLVGLRTAELVGIEHFRFCGEHKVKGRTELVSVFTPLSHKFPKL